MPTDALVTVEAIDAGVRPVTLRLPFRFGAITLQRCPQLFLRARVRVGGRTAHGFAAEMLVPKWFDKRPGFDNAQNVAQLVASVERAAAAYGAHPLDGPATPFGLFERHYAALMRAGADAGATALTSAYGQAVLDRAVLDGVCHAAGVSFFEAAAQNLLGLADSPLLPDLGGHDWAAWLRTLVPLRRVAARHTVGLLDALKPLAADDAEAGDGLPVSLPAVIRRQGSRFFKIKLGGQPAADVERLGAVLAVLDREAPGHRYTLDGNEQYADAGALQALFDALRASPGLARRPDALLYIEQPLARDASLGTDLPWRRAPAPLLLDEADGTLDAFPEALRAGWHGVSSKSCKGLYKALANRARCDRFNAAAARDVEPPRAFMSAEDLTCQAGLSVQQDLALASLLGLRHCERNGHHYGGGFGTAPAAEQQAFAAAHADLYDRGPAGSDPPRLHVRAGDLLLGSLFAPGFAHAGGAEPDFGALQPLAAATSLL